jgi:UDP-N-acetylmuramoylalanine--D-glutamate ligase
VIGYGLSGRAAARWLVDHGWDVTVLEDDPRAAEAAMEAAGRAPAGTAERIPGGTAMGRLRVEVGPGPERAGEVARSVELVVPSPGVVAVHPALAAALAAGVEVSSEIELAWTELAAQRAGRAPGGGPLLVAITGTNGKTTVTGLVVAMLVASGLGAVAAGNVGYPLLEAVRSDAADVVVAEVSSFQLEYTKEFRPDVSCWLNFAPDHLDWHPSLDDYARAKARIWANQVPGSTVVVNAGDAAVNAAAAATVPPGAVLVSFGTSVTSHGQVPGGQAPQGPTWRVGDDAVEGPGGLVLRAAELPRALPHDLANTAAAMAVAVAAGASRAGCLAAARATPAPPHRVQFVGASGGTAWYDDSKATTPAAALAGARSFPSVVLIAGGHNKGLDLSELARAVPPVRAVVAIGEAAGEVVAAFAGHAPVRAAGSMEEAVAVAAELARPGDAVVLSPGCASFDWYRSYAERGEHFAGLVRARLEEVGEQ